jgi:prolipoprotein diacylglyceryltransferase
VMLVLSRHPPDGTAVIFYVAGYCVSQFLLFFVRATEPTILLGLKQAQVTSLVVLLVVVPLLILLRMRFPRIFAAEAPATDAGDHPDLSPAAGHLANEGG